VRLSSLALVDISHITSSFIVDFILVWSFPAFIVCGHVPYAILQDMDGDEDEDGLTLNPSNLTEPTRTTQDVPYSSAWRSAPQEQLWHHISLSVPGLYAVTQRPFLDVHHPLTPPLTRHRPTTNWTYNTPLKQRQ
jgi:hypothetical protein